MWRSGISDRHFAVAEQATDIYHTSIIALQHCLRHTDTCCSLNNTINNNWQASAYKFVSAVVRGEEGEKNQQRGDGGRGTWSGVEGANVRSRVEALAGGNSQVVACWARQGYDLL